MKKVEHRKDINSFLGFEPMHKGAFEHEMNTKGKDTLLTRQMDKWSSPVRNEPLEALETSFSLHASSQPEISCCHPNQAHAFAPSCLFKDM